jgi:hypothetical protein
VPVFVQLYFLFVCTDKLKDEKSLPDTSDALCAGGGSRGPGALFDFTSDMVVCPSNLWGQQEGGRSLYEDQMCTTERFYNGAQTDVNTNCQRETFTVSIQSTRFYLKTSPDFNLNSYRTLTICISLSLSLFNNLFTSSIWVSSNCSTFHFRCNSMSINLIIHKLRHTVCTRVAPICTVYFFSDRTLGFTITTP